MDHTMLIPTCRIKLWFGFIVSFLFCYLLLENFDWYTSSSSFTSFSLEEKPSRTVHSLDSITKTNNDGDKSNKPSNVIKQRIPSRNVGLKDSNPASDSDTDDEIDWIKDVGQLQDLEKELESILFQDNGRKQEDEDDDDEDEDMLNDNVNNTRRDQVRQVSHSKHSNSGKNSANSSSKVVDSSSDVCSGRYIYVHQLPAIFNDDILRNCQALSKWNDLCQYVKNMGLGPDLGNPQRAFLPTGWFSTNQFFLEVIFHNRMKQYECLTKNSSKASAVFVPYYAGLDVVRYLWGSNITTRDSTSLELVKWLKKQPEWKVMSGGDHFLVAGRITWDFRRTVDKDSGWGNKLMALPELKNVTILTIESSPWHSNDFAIPYPTYFHPSHDMEIEQWQNKVRKQRRKMLFSFAGAPRPNIEDSIRNEIMDQCSAAKRKCKLVECTNKSNKCQKPLYLMRLFENSVFCLQPPGDSFTRRSTFDSILAGCIPVFFTPASAYVQYLWHLPKDYERYSVLIPEDDIKENKVSIDKILSQIPRRRVNAMREEVIRLIPKVIYADPRSKLERYEDAFDLSVKGVLERVKTLRKNSSSFQFEAESSWKYFLFGTIKEHEWDHFFRRTNRVRY